MQELKEHFKLDQAKKQWLLCGASLLIALSTGAAVAHADTNPNPVNQAPVANVDPTRPASAVPDQGANTPATSNTTTAQTAGATTTPASTVQHATFALNPSFQLNSEGDYQAQNNRDTTTTFGSEIDPTHYQVTVNVPELAYEIPPYQLQKGDLRFATNEEVSHLANWTQPALVNGQAVNVGTYLVFLSQMGYNNLTAWINGNYVNGV